MRKPKRNNQHFEAFYGEEVFSFTIDDEELVFNQLMAGFNSAVGKITIFTEDDLGFKPNDVIIFNDMEMIINSISYANINTPTALRSNEPIRRIRMVIR